MKNERSTQLFQQAIKSIPGGVNSPVRAFRSVGSDPLFIKRAAGSQIFDEDGNAFIDYVGSWGPMIVGHCHPTVVAAIKNAVDSGCSFGAPTELEITLAEMVIDAVPSIEMVRMVSSGTEATMSAIRLARGYTNRDNILKFSGCYHGHSDALLVKARSITDVTERQSLYRDIAEIYLQDRPMMVLYHQNWLFAHSDKLSGFVPVADGLIRPQGIQIKE